MKHLGSLRAYLHLDMLSNQPQVSSICSRSLVSIYIKQVLFICLVCLSCLFSTYSSANSALSNKEIIELSAEEREWLKQNPHIRFSTLTDQPPVTMKDSEGRHVGIISDIFSHLSRAIGQELETELLDDNTKVHSHAKAKGMYGSSAIFKTPQHQKEYLLSDPYLVTPFYVFTTKNKLSVFKQANDLKGKRVAIPRGHRAIADYLNKIGSEEVIVNSPLEQMQKVLSGEADAMMGYINYPYLINKYLMVDLEMAFVAESDLGLHVGVNPEHPLLQSILNKAIATISQQTRQNILAKWTEISRDESPQIGFTEEEKAWLAGNPVIRLGNSVDWPPFGFINKEGVYSGIAAEYIATIENVLGITIEPAKLASWKETVDAARASEVDLLDAVVPTPQRKEFLTFTKPYISYPVVLFAHKDVDYIANMSALNEQRVTVIAGSALHDILINNHPEFVIVPTENARAGLLAVEKRKASAFIGNLLTASQVMSREGISDLKVAGETPYRYDLTIGVNKHKPILASLLQKALDSIPEEKHNEIYRKWMSVTFEHKTDYTIIFQILVFVTLLLAIFLYWNRRLSREVHQRKHTEEALHRTYEGLQKSHQRLSESELWQRGIFDSLEEGVMVVNPNRKISDVNPACRTIFGYSREEITDQSTEILHVDHAHYVEFGEHITAAFEQDKPAHFEFEAKRKNGEIFPSEHTVSLLKSESGEVIGIVSIIRDISTRKQAETELLHHREDLEKQVADRTMGLEKLNEQLQLEILEHKQTEDELRKSEQYNRTLFDESTIGLALCQMNGELVDINPAYAAILGRTVAETLSLSYWEITPEKYAAEEQAQLGRLEKIGRYGPYEKDYIHADGHLVPVRLSGQILEKGGEQFIWSSVEDITERKKADQALRKSEKDLQTIFNNMQDVFYRADIEGRIIMLSPSAKGLMQYTLEELMGQKLADYYVDPDGRNKFLKALEEGGGSIQGYEAAVRNKHGNHVWISTNAHYFYDDEGNINGVEGAIRDITARKKAEDDLKNSERGLSEAQRIAHLGSWEWDIITNDLSWTDQIFRIFGLEPQEFVPTYPAFLERIHPDDRQSVTDAVENAVSNNQPYEIEHRIVTPYGEVRHVLEIGEVQYDKNNKPINMIGSVQDVTERKQAEDAKEHLQRELQQAQKMEALGKLTGGIAHEYNNMLAVMLGFTDLLKMSFSEQPKLLKYADEIQHAGERAAKLTSKLLTFSRHKTPEAKSLNLNTLLQKQQHMLEKTLTVRINLILNLQDDLWQAWLDEGDTEDAIINMSINAMHAIEGNGQLTIQMSNQKINQMDAKPLGIQDGDYVSLSLTDSGCGIDEKIKEKIFDPFFTTKGMEGTGLGLSMVYGFVQNSGGAIKVYSEPGEGTQFTLYFPRYHGASRDQQSEEGNHLEDNLIGNKTILVVDDEQALLNLSREILSSHGFKVICAESAKDALNILQHESIDILISDIIMPEMDGYQLAAIVKEKYPEIKIQLASGFTDERNMGVNDEHLQQDLLHKPFSSQALLQRIRALCGEN